MAYRTADQAWSKGLDAGKYCKEGNGKPLLDSNSCLKNPLLDLQESEQTRRVTN